MADVIGAAEFELRATKDKLKADVESAERDLKQSVERIERDYGRGGRDAASAFGRGQRQMVREAQDAERQIRASAGGIRTALMGAAGALATLLSARQAQQLADAWTDLNSRVRLAVGAHEDAEAVMGRIASMARRTYSSLEVTAEGFLRNATAMREMGYSTATTLDFVEALNNGMVVSGAKAERAEVVMNALSRAMALGQLRGENLNTVIQNGGRITDVLAASLGVATTELRSMGERGLLTTDVLVQALTGSLEQLRQEADSMPATVSDSFVILGNALTEYIGKTDQALGATERVAQGIIALADNIDDLAPILAALIVGVGTAYVGGAIAATGATLTWATALRGLNVAMLTISRHPLIAALTVIASGLTYLALQTREATVATEDYQRANTALEQATSAYEEAARAAAVATGEEAEAARQAATEKRDLAVAAREAARAKLAEAAATLALAQAESARFTQTERYNIRGDRPGRYAEAGRISGVVGQAQANFDSVLSAIRAANTAIEEADAAIAAARPRSPGTTSTAGGSGASGHSEADIARMQEELRLRLQIETARARGDAAAQAEAEDRLDVLRLIADLERAQIATGEEARAIAEAHVGQLREMATAQESLTTLRQAFLQIERDVEDARARTAELAADQLAHEIQIARLSGNEALFRSLSREEEIRRRIVRLMELQVGLSEDAARKQATREAIELDAAEREGRMRDEFRKAFTGGIRAAIDGDVGSFFERLADRFTDRMLENLADDLFDLFLNASRGLQGGGGGLSSWISAAASIFGAQVTSPALGAPKVGGLPGSAMAAPSAGASMMKALIRVESNDDKFRLFIQETAGPMVVEGGLRAAQGGARMAAESANRTRYYLKGAN